MKPGSYILQGLKQTFSLIPVFLGSLLSESALNCKLSNFKHTQHLQLSVNLWISPRLRRGITCIRLARKNYIKQRHLWPEPRIEFQRCSNAQGFCRFKSLLTLSMADFQALLPTSIYAPPVLLTLILPLIPTLHRSLSFIWLLLTFLRHKSHVP